MRLPALPSAVLLAALPLAAQSWGLRIEVPFPKGQNLPQTLLTGTGQLASGTLDTGKGLIATLDRRLVVFGPVLRLEATFEGAWLQTEGDVRVGTTLQQGTLTQAGLGVGLNAQFWIPFVDLGAEVGLIERAQRYHYEAAGATVTHTLGRPWLRVGGRWRLPLPYRPYLAASYQQPLSKDRPVRLVSAADLATLLGAQGSGQEFDRMWTFGAGWSF
jgi:hypothetical protein